MLEADIHCLYKQKVINKKKQTINSLQPFTIDFNMFSYFETVA